jgi:hypothetical protein
MGRPAARCLLQAEPEGSDYADQHEALSRANLGRLFDALGPRLTSPREIGVYFKEKI